MIEEKRTDLELIRDIKNGDIGAKLVLWNRYMSFTKTRFFKEEWAYSSSNVNLSEYMQEAYIAFEDAVAQFDLDKAQQSNLTMFYTYYYYKLMRLKTHFNRYSKKYTKVVLESDIHTLSDSINNNLGVDKTDSYDDPWTNATMGDENEDIEKASAEEVVRTYMREASPLHRKVMQYLLEGNSMRGLPAFMAEDGYDTSFKVRKLIKEIREGISKLSDKIAFA